MSRIPTNPKSKQSLTAWLSKAWPNFDESKYSEEQMWAIFHSTRKKHKQKSARNRKRSVANGTKMAKR